MAISLFQRLLRRAGPGSNRHYALLPASPAPSVNSATLPDDVESASELREDACDRRRLLIRAVAQLTSLFLVGSIILGGTLYFALPPLDETDRPLLHVPTSFDELKALNTLLKKIKLVYPFRTIICFVVTYLYLQAFSLPGSMYLSILAGAVWGMPVALPLCCLCVATGATLCYLLSACFGPALMLVPKFKARIDAVAMRIDAPGHRENLIPYMIVLRMAPLPPHWAVNLAAPHLNIGVVPFYIAAFLGIAGVTTIHTTIGGGLDQMTSSDDFHLISWQNFFGLAAVICAVCVPIIVRWKWRNELQDVEQECSCSDVTTSNASHEDMQEVQTPTFRPPRIVIGNVEAGEEEVRLYSPGGLGLVGV